MALDPVEWQARRPHGLFYNRPSLPRQAAWKENCKAARNARAADLLLGLARLAKLRTYSDRCLSWREIATATGQRKTTMYSWFHLPFELYA